MNDETIDLLKSIGLAVETMAQRIMEIEASLETAFGLITQTVNCVSALQKQVSALDHRVQASASFRPYE